MSTPFTRFPNTGPMTATGDGMTISESASTSTNVDIDVNRGTDTSTSSNFNSSASSSANSTGIGIDFSYLQPSASIHPSSLVGPEVLLGEGVSIGPFCILQGKVEIGKGTVLHSHVSIGSEQGRVVIGEHNTFFAGAVIGGIPQDKSYQKTLTSLLIGDHNIFREYVTVHLATEKEDHFTQIGSHNYIMAYSHIAHNCLLKDNITIANGVQLAGHVHVGSGVTIGGMSGITQFVRLGQFSFLGAKAEVRKDVLPFCCVGFGSGGRIEMKSSNKVGLQRAGFSQEEIESLHKAIRILKFGCSTVKEGVSRIQKECGSNPSIQYLLQFIQQCKTSFVQ